MRLAELSPGSEGYAAAASHVETAKGSAFQVGRMGGARGIYG
jgi:hypothetical protein